MIRGGFHELFFFAWSHSAVDVVVLCIIGVVVMMKIITMKLSSFPFHFELNRGEM